MRKRTGTSGALQEQLKFINILQDLQWLIIIAIVFRIFTGVPILNRNSHLMDFSQHHQPAKHASALKQTPSAAAGLKGAERISTKLDPTLNQRVAFSLEHKCKGCNSCKEGIVVLAAYNDPRGDGGGWDVGGQSLVQRALTWGFQGKLGTRISTNGRN